MATAEKGQVGESTLGKAIADVLQLSDGRLFLEGFTADGAAESKIVFAAVH